MNKTKPASRIFFSFLVLTFILIWGCEKISNVEPVKIGEPFFLKIGTMYKINPALTFTIDSINDYRCPADFMCLWSGDVDSYFNINYNSTKIDTVVSLYTRNRNPFQIGDYSWHILGVSPLGKSTEVIKQTDYKIEMIINKN